MSLSPEQAQATSRRMTVLGGSFLFFAYGSNMLTDRLRERCPDARPLGAAIARGYVLSFSKRSRDGSSKATLLTRCRRSQAGCVWGPVRDSLGSAQKTR